MSSLEEKGSIVVLAIEACEPSAAVGQALFSFREYVTEVKKILDAAIAAQTKEADRASKRRL